MAKRRDSPPVHPDWPAALVAIAERFSPPSIDLREARLEDDHGNEAHALVMVSHSTVEDVRDEELEYYADVFAFLDTKSLFFYLLPVCEAFRHNEELDCIDRFLMSLDASVPSWDGLLSEAERGSIRAYLVDLFLGHGGAAWNHCYGLQKEMGLL